MAKFKEQFLRYLVSNNNLVFKTFDEAKKYLLSNPGGSIVRLDSNAGFYINLHNTKLSTKPTIHETRKANKTPAISSHSKQISSTKPKDSEELKTPTWKTAKLSDPIKSRVIKHKRNPINSNNLPKSRTTQHTSPSRRAPGKPMRTHSPEQSDNFPKKYIDEPTGSREDFKKMRGRQHFGNKTGNH